MRTRYLLCGMLLPLALLLAAHDGAAAAEPRDRGGQERALRLIRLAGLDHTVSSFPRQLEAQFLQSRSPLPEDMSRSIMQVMLAAFDDASAEALLADYVLQHSNRRQQEAIIAWFDSELGRRFQAAEERVSDEQGRRALQAYLEDSDRMPPSSRRAALVARFEQAAQLSDSAIAMMEVIMRGQTTAINAGLAAEQRAPAAEVNAELDDRMNALRPVMGERIRGQLLPLLHFSFTGFSDDELQQYLDFLESAAGDKFVAISRRGIEAVFTAMMQRAIDHVVAQRSP